VRPASGRTALLALLLVGFAAWAPAAGAATPAPGLSLTVVARECPTYQDVTANLLRNNLMESLRDLGPDTPYGAGALMDPQVEAAAQPNCSPLTNWTFTLGEAIEAPEGESKEPWGALSIVRRPFSTDLTTVASTPLLDSHGAPTGKSIAAAKTVTLTSAQAKLAARGSLWIQGGSPSDPVLAQRFPGPLYGFAALRCAIDNVNGDNVEYVSYPAGVTHVFCFAYYVKPPPTSGTIVIRKEVDGPEGISERFNFAGNVSYEPGGAFSLDVEDGRPAEERFYRGATGSGEPWRVRERETVDWRLAALDCVSRDGTSSVETSVASGEAQIDLGGGDLVTCTYTNAYSPPPRGLSLRKITEGGIGHFDFTVTPLGGGEPSTAEATTREEGVAVEAEPASLDLPAGQYEVTERLPASRRGTWRLSDVQCEAKTRRIAPPVEVTLPAGEGRVCTFTNTFVPRGAITISKVTRGGVGTSHFLIKRQGEEPASYQQLATTTEEGVAVRARGDATDHLQLGDYVIVDSPPPPGGGNWSLDYVQCDGRALPFSQGRVEISLTAEHPRRHCTFVNRFEREPEPPRPPPLDPSPQAELVVDKQAPGQVATVGGTVVYRISVASRGADPATEVRLIDQPAGSVDLVSAQSADGVCSQSLPVVCRLGTIAPGSSKSVTVRLRVFTAGLLINRAVSGTGTSAVAGVDAAQVRVKGPPLPSFPGLG
jgi:uncharacterized repeat protein (TIGR01451 family)